jgi:predicted TIM-barrel fold metal-dependent hydrolase
VDSVSYGRAPCCAALEALGPDRLVHGSDYPFAAGVGLDDLATLGDDLVHAADRGSMSLASALTTVI